MPSTANPLIGREAELDAVFAMLDGRDELPRIVVLHGQAGIGKTSVWLAGVEAAATGGYRILLSRPAEAETRLSYSGLADLLGDVAAELLPELPRIQRRALEAALLIGDSEATADERAVGAALFSALRLLAAETPLCVAVDDLQWLDVASASALQYALARLAQEPVAALLTVRGEPPPWIRRSSPEVASNELGGLSIGAIRELLHARLDASFPRPTLTRLWETSGGNPLFALELAVALQRRGRAAAPSEPLPVPASLEALLHERLEGLGPAALEVTRVVASLAEPTTDLLEAAVPTSEAGLGEAMDAGVLELDEAQVRFTHPLLGSVVTARLTASRRRSLHARLAEIVPSSQERAWHLALATTEPRDKIAAILEDAARSARDRGAPATAAELAEHALRLTPTGKLADARRRLFLAAERYHAAGDSAAANALLARARDEAVPGVDRAAVLLQLGAVQREPRDAETIYLDALAEAGGDHALEAAAHLRLAALMQWSGGVERGVEHSGQAVRLAARTDDVALRCAALAAQADWQFRAGLGLRRAEMAEAIALARALPDESARDEPSCVFCQELVWSVELDTARELALGLRDSFRARNDAGGEAFALWELGFLEWRAGNWNEAERYATGALEIRAQLGRVLPHDEFPVAIIAAHQGRIVEARARSTDAAARAESQGIRIAQSGHGWVLGFIELSLGDPAGALPSLRRSHELRNLFMYDPGHRVELGDLLETLVACGELDEADGILADWEPRAAALDRSWALAILARCRGLLLAARGDLQGAFASFERALAEHDRAGDPFHHARTLLALGRTQRRAKKRAAARATLEDALACFDRLGAPLWAEQTRAELARIGGRTRSDELTEAERRIAALVAEGQTNREVAAALFLTVRSVETALTRIYRKLEVRSRAELAHRLRAKT